MNRRIHKPADDEDDDVVKGNPGLWGVAAAVRPPVSSVFGAGEQAAPRAKAARSLSVEIERGVPLPPKPKSNAFVDLYGDVLRKMAKGDCVKLPHARARAMQKRARNLGIKVARRKVDALLSGVWRL